MVNPPPRQIIGTTYLHVGERDGDGERERGFSCGGSGAARTTSVLMDGVSVFVLLSRIYPSGQPPLFQASQSSVKVRESTNTGPD